MVKLVLPKKKKKKLISINIFFIELAGNVFHIFEEYQINSLYLSTFAFHEYQAFERKSSY